MGSESKKKVATMLIWGIPQTLKNQFKAACAQQDLSMKEVLVRAMKKFVTETKRKEK